MSRSNKVGTHKTSIRTTDGMTHIRYHSTDVVSFNDEKIILRSGGWMTNTTKLRINQTSEQFSLGIGVRQHKFEWFVTLKNPEYRSYSSDNVPYWLPKEIPFNDGMTLIRTHFGRKVVPFLPIVEVPATTK